MVQLRRYMPAASHDETLNITEERLMIVHAIVQIRSMFEIHSTVLPIVFVTRGDHKHLEISTHN